MTTHTSSAGSPKCAPFRYAAWAFMIAVGFVAAWVGRYSMNPDGMCYLDLGDAAWSGRWSDAVNAYWSPLYAWLVGAALHVVRPSRHGEFPLVHAVNFIIYLLALVSFEFFLKSLLVSLRQSTAKGSSADLEPPAEWSLICVSYGLFLWTSIELVTVYDVGADLAVAALIYLIAALFLRIRRGAGLFCYALLGATLGIAYLTKAVMFPLGFLFILIGLFWVPRAKRLPYLLLVTLCFLVVSAPWVVALSMGKGKFTFGDSGMLNYSALVSPGGRVINWQGEPAASGVPLHATREVLHDPPVYEFATPIGGTYPPSFDPAYWNAGRTWTFNLGTQLRVIKWHILTYAALFLRSQPGLLAAALTLIFIGGSATRKAVLEYWPLFMMGFAAMGLYMLVHVETRFVAAYLCIFWVTLLFGVRLPKSGGQLKMAAYLIGAVTLTLVLSVADGTARAMRSSGPYSARDHIAVSDGLMQIGVQPGDRVAVLGDGNWSYWARLGRFRIVTNVMGADTPLFWAASSQQKAKVFQIFAQSGARVVVANNLPPLAVLDASWQPIGTTGYYFRWVSP
jgi:hypothetical protein